MRLQRAAALPVGSPSPIIASAMPKKTDVRRTPTKDQVSAWLSTVLTPLRNSLTIELHFTTRGSWSFRYETQDFEYLSPISKMIAAPYSANLEQVFRYYPSLQAEAALHDNTLDALRQACRTAYEKVTRSPGFQNLPVPIDPVGPDSRRYLAEYVINRYRDLPSHYILADFWRTHGTQYLSLRRDPTLTKWFKSIDERGFSFRRALVRLSKNIRRLQERIADEAGLPPSGPATV